MKKFYYVLTVLALLLVGHNLYSQVRAFTPRYTNTSVRGNIKYVSNNIITTNGVATTDAPPSGTAVNNNAAGVNIDIDANNTTLIPWNSTWRYADSGYAPGTTTWRNTTYPDGGWLTATAGLPASAQRDIGYGDGDEVLPYIYSGCGARPGVASPSCTSKYWTTYFRQQFTVASVAAFSSFRINLHRDDGAVIYINGVEVTRSNMPTGTIVYTTPASSSVDGSNEDVTIDIPTTNFVNGTNTIAVEVHQNSQSSSDISFRLELLGMPPDSTFNSSSADLSLNACADVLWAGLYWGSTLGNSSQGTWRTGRDTAYFKIPGASTYTKVLSTQTDLHDSSAANNHTGYQCFADVTALINATNASGTYTIANVRNPVSTGLNNQAAGWTLVIAYRDPTTIPRNLAVFDGFDLIAPGTQKDVKIAGFLTPLTGPVTCELGAVCYDGDRGSGDGFFFKQDSAAAGTYTDLSNTGTSGNADSWNSTISYFGANVTTRSPAHANTLGYDADIIQLPNTGNLVLGNNKTSARIRISSPSSGGENFFLQVVTSSISVSNPSFTMIKSATDLSGGSWLPGDSLQYKLVTTNGGVDTSINTVIIDTLPTNVNYKAGSLRINNIAKTDAAGDDEAEYDPVGRRVIFRVGTSATAVNGGEIIPNKSDSVSFKVTATEICQVLQCSAVASNQAQIDYTGKNSLQSFYNRSGYLTPGGCFVEAPITNTITGTCISRSDTTVVNQCPTLSYTLPASLYTGYTFYRAIPFTPANQYNTATPITLGGTYYAFWSSGAGCNDTIRFNVLIQPCPDIDDDDDGIPDYVESNGADAFADDDSDGIPNFADASYPGFVDSDADGVNDNFDTDRDGIPNQIDLDSDNDGIPDVVEAYGVDADGNGRIDNFTDTDNDGLSQNVDANSTGQTGSGNGLGLPDFDGDDVPNYIDSDSDNDGIPDVLEAGGADADNDGVIDNYFDSDADGYSDNVDGDVGNDGSSENSAASLLRTGADTNNDGRANSFPYKNMDADFRPNPYDLDSDGDGITDVKEAGFTDSNNDGRADGAIGTNGWNSAIDILLAFITLPNTDASGNSDYLDIDSDNDGIPDNIEGLSTSGYLLPIGSDSDGDGIDNAYDNIVGFGANGITPNDQDGDGVPDYRDTDTDGDSVNDIIEGNDLNHNCLPDDNVMLSGSDSDGDGLDNFFDADNTSAQNTSAYMGNGGSTSGDITPGSITTVQSCSGVTERDWRYIPYILDADFLDLDAAVVNNKTKVNWKVTCSRIIDHFVIERSTDGIHYKVIGSVAGIGASCNATPFATSDNNISGVGSVLYYRVKAISKDGTAKISQVVLVKLKREQRIVVSPNPANAMVSVTVATTINSKATVQIMDANGKIVLQQSRQLNNGINSFTLTEVSRIPNGVYTLQVITNNEMFNQRLVVQR